MIHWSPLMLVTACLFWAVALVFLGNSLGKAHSRLIAVKVPPPMQHSPLTAHRAPLTAPAEPARTATLQGAILGLPRRRVRDVDGGVARRRGDAHDELGLRAVRRRHRLDLCGARRDGGVGLAQG